MADDHPRDYTYMELLWATDCFSRKRILGKGGFGSVYKGTLRDNTLVAIKRLNIQGSLQGHKEFVAEIAAITNLKHENVVSLKGYCMFLRERLLVYEYMPNKTLEHHLHGMIMMVTIFQKTSWFFHIILCAKSFFM